MNAEIRIYNRFLTCKYAIHCACFPAEDLVVQSVALLFHNSSPLLPLSLTFLGNTDFCSSSYTSNCIFLPVHKRSTCG